MNGNDINTGNDLLKTGNFEQYVKQQQQQRQANQQQPSAVTTSAINYKVDSRFTPKYDKGYGGMPTADKIKFENMQNNNKGTNNPNNIAGNNGYGGMPTDVQQRMKEQQQIKTKLETLPSRGNIEHDQINFKRIARTKDGATNEVFITVNDQLFGDNGELSYQIQPDGKSVLITEDGVPMGWTDIEGIKGLVAEDISANPNNIANSNPNNNNSNSHNGMPSDVEQILYGNKDKPNNNPQKTMDEIMREETRKGQEGWSQNNNGNNHNGMPSDVEKILSENKNNQNNNPQQTMDEIMRAETRKGQEGWSQNNNGNNHNGMPSDVEKILSENNQNNKPQQTMDEIMRAETRKGQEGWNQNNNGRLINSELGWVAHEKTPGSGHLEVQAGSDGWDAIHGSQQQPTMQSTNVEPKTFSNVFDPSKFYDPSKLTDQQKLEVLAHDMNQVQMSNNTSPTPPQTVDARHIKTMLERTGQNLDDYYNAIYLKRTQG